MYDPPALPTHAIGDTRAAHKATAHLQRINDFLSAAEREVSLNVDDWEGEQYKDLHITEDGQAKGAFVRITYIVPVKPKAVSFTLHVGGYAISRVEVRRVGRGFVTKYYPILENATLCAASLVPGVLRETGDFTVESYSFEQILWAFLVENKIKTPPSGAILCPYAGFHP